MILTPRIDMIAGAMIGCALAGLGAGWQINNWRHTAALAAERDANQRAINAASQRESAIAAQLEKRLANLRANQTVIDRGVIREIQKPVYRVVCIQPDGLRYINAAAAGTSPPAESDSEMPANPADHQ